MSNEKKCPICEVLPIKLIIPAYKSMLACSADRPEIEINLEVKFCPNCGKKIEVV